MKEKKPGARIKERKVPQRTCIGCGEIKPKNELIRIVRTPEGAAKVDLSSKASGRGAYICPKESCFQKAVKRRSFERSLKVKIDEKAIEGLHKELKELENFGE